MDAPSSLLNPIRTSLEALDLIQGDLSPRRGIHDLILPDAYPELEKLRIDNCIESMVTIFEASLPKLRHFDFCSGDKPHIDPLCRMLTAASPSLKHLALTMADQSGRTRIPRQLFHTITQFQELGTFGLFGS